MNRKILAEIKWFFSETLYEWTEGIRITWFRIVQKCTAQYMRYIRRIRCFALAYDSQSQDCIHCTYFYRCWKSTKSPSEF